MIFRMIILRKIFAGLCVVCEGLPFNALTHYNWNGKDFAKKLWKSSEKSLQLWKIVVVCMDNFSFSCSGTINMKNLAHK